MRLLTRNNGLALVFCGALLANSRGQEEGEDVQTPTDVFQDGVDNGSDDIAVAAVFHKDLLYVAITTQTFLEEDFVGEEGETTDIVIKSFDSTLAAEEFNQLGGDMDDTVTAIAAREDVMNDIVIVGSTESVDEHLFDLDTPTGEMDWFIATMDRTDLSVTNAYVNGTQNDNQEATAVAICSDGGFIVAGYTWGRYFEDNVGEDNDESSIGFDAWVLKINEDLDPDFEWSIQFGTIAYDVPSAVVVDSSDNVYVVGTTRDDGDVLSDSEEEEEVQSMFVYALDPDDGDSIWEVTTALGFLSDGSQAYGAVLNEDEDELYVSGSTRGIIPGYDGDTTDSEELFVVSLDTSDGSTNWVWQSEANATSFGTGGIVLADDGVSPIVSGIAFGNQFNLTFTYWEGGSGDMVAAKIDTELMEVSKYFVAAAASNLTREQPYAIVKDESVVDGVYLIGEEDGDFEDEDVEPGDANYLLLRVELEELPEVEEEDSSGRDFPYYYVGIPVFAIGGVLFIVAYKCAVASQRAKLKQATMV